MSGAPIIKPKKPKLVKMIIYNINDIDSFEYALMARIKPKGTKKAIKKTDRNCCGGYSNTNNLLNE